MGSPEGAQVSELARLFGELFSPAELRRFLLDWPAAHVCIEDISFEGAPRDVCVRAAERLGREGLIGPELEERLRRERPLKMGVSKRGLGPESSDLLRRARRWWWVRRVPRPPQILLWMAVGVAVALLWRRVSWSGLPWEAAPEMEPGVWARAALGLGVAMALLLLWTVDWRSLWRGRGRSLELQAPVFRGPVRFQERDASVWPPRVRELARLEELVREHPFVVLEGESGVGKSSLLAAGLVPRLDVWARPLLVRLRGDPLESVAGVMAVEPQPAAIRERARALAATQPGRPVVLLLDQLDEIFASCPPVRRLEFGELLRELVLSGEARICVALRSDFIDLLLRWVQDVDPEEGTLKLNRRYQLRRWTEAEACEVVEQLFQTVGSTGPDTRELAHEMARQLARPPADRRSTGGEPGVLPVELQLVGWTLEEAAGGDLSLRTFSRLGGPEGLLRRLLAEERRKVELGTRGSVTPASLDRLLSLLARREREGAARSVGALAQALGLPPEHVSAALAILGEDYVVERAPVVGEGGEDVQLWRFSHDYLRDLVLGDQDPKLLQHHARRERLRFWIRQDAARAGVPRRLAWLRALWRQPMPLAEVLRLWRVPESSEERRAIRRSLSGFGTRMLTVGLLSVGGLWAASYHPWVINRVLTWAVIYRPVGPFSRGSEEREDFESWDAMLSVLTRAGRLRDVQVLLEETRRPDVLVSEVVSVVGEAHAFGEASPAFLRWASGQEPALRLLIALVLERDGSGRLTVAQWDARREDLAALPEGVSRVAARAARIALIEGAPPDRVLEGLELLGAIVRTEGDPGERLKEWLEQVNAGALGQDLDPVLRSVVATGEIEGPGKKGKPFKLYIKDGQRARQRLAAHRAREGDWTAFVSDLIDARTSRMGWNDIATLMIQTDLGPPPPAVQERLQRELVAARASASARLKRPGDRDPGCGHLGLVLLVEGEYAALRMASSTGCDDLDRELGLWAVSNLGEDALRDLGVGGLRGLDLTSKGFEALRAGGYNYEVYVLADEVALVANVWEPQLASGSGGSRQVALDRMVSATAEAVGATGGLDALARWTGTLHGEGQLAAVEVLSDLDVLRGLSLAEELEPAARLRFLRRGGGIEPEDCTPAEAERLRSLIHAHPEALEGEIPFGLELTLRGCGLQDLIAAPGLVLEADERDRNLVWGMRDDLPPDFILEATLASLRDAPELLGVQAAVAEVVVSRMVAAGRGEEVRWLAERLADDLSRDRGTSVPDAEELLIAATLVEDLNALGLAQRADELLFRLNGAFRTTLRNSDYRNSSDARKLGPTLVHAGRLRQTLLDQLYVSPTAQALTWAAVLEELEGLEPVEKRGLLRLPR